MLTKKFTSRQTRRVNAKNRLKYSAKDYKNPFFQERKSRRKRTNFHFSFPYKVYFAVFFAIITFALIYAAYGPFFRIKAITVSGQGRIEAQAIENIAWELINDNYFVLYPQKNIFLFRANKLKEVLSKKYAFSGLTVEKKPPRTLVITYEEKAYAAIFSENEEYFYIDPTGYVVSNADLLEISERDYPIISNNSSDRITGKQAPITAAAISAVAELFQSFKGFEDELKPERFFIDNEADTVKLKLKSGPVLIFSSQNAIQDQIAKLQIIRSEKLQGIFSDKEYIDLRYGSSVYYR